MSGHSKWSTIKRKKGANDAQRAKIFTKVAREILVAVKAGGPDPDNNSALKDAISKARSVNMPNDNISRTIKKAAGSTEGDNYETVVYEGYGPSGVAVIVDSLTDNRNRTAANVRHYFDKFGGNLGTNGCVSFMFDQKGVIIIENDGISEDEITMDALEAGAEDLSINDDCIEVTSAPEDFHSVRDALEAKYTISSAELSMVPQTMTKISDEEHITLMGRLLDSLDDDDDVQNVYHNWDMPDDIE
ncbi:MAG: YebC/PmpR family DNA-binding transcriptional regulator [Firmicutes bacterium]|nr:YebC/PmpR family DNA-binding transcriptional regulator [Bacillota bacterium]